MKDFSEYEKQILKELIRVDDTPGASTVLGNIIDFELSPNFYVELKSPTNCTIRISKSFIDNISLEYGSVGLSDILKQFNTKLLIIVDLFEYLERKHLIRLTSDFPITILGTTFDVNETPVGYELEDKTLSKLLYHFARILIVPSESLKRYVNNNFKTNGPNGEQPVHDKKTHSVTKWVLWLTAVLVLLTIYLVWDVYKDKHSQNENGNSEEKQDIPISPEMPNTDTLNNPNIKGPVEKKPNEPNKQDAKKDKSNNVEEKEKEELKKGIMDDINR